MKSMYILNQELNGIEIYFEEKPGEIIRSEIKKAGYRWSKRKSCWYAKQTPERIELAEKLTTGRAETEEIIKQEIKQKKTEAKLTIEQMEEAAKGYTFRETGSGLYAGWTGCNNRNGLYGTELKKVILAELKKNGIQATCRQGRGVGTDSFTFTIRVPEEFQLSLEDFIQYNKEELRQPYWYTDHTNRKDVSRDALWDLPEEERERIIREHWTHTYEWQTRDGECIPSDAFQKFVEAIVSSFNSDHSNGMVDYFDRGFYDWYKWKAA